MEKVFPFEKYNLLGVDGNYVRFEIKVETESCIKTITEQAINYINDNYEKIGNNNILKNASIDYSIYKVYLSDLDGTPKGDRLEKNSHLSDHLAKNTKFQSLTIKFDQECLVTVRKA
eukprot:CAMPEP_0116883016 /NCGR_PEP_ID=MMETSP0463-20121206/15434_1 /TAXON_ID=181622 /ORGANISM="Strombidinopsis sp, Strain SopsisLIS2011" /LENGTH=116 /DNA_ID=CAMNT_0004537151 /DNA_START=762 /DNA_END=1112 /DNA_ORIENTATION=-